MRATPVKINFALACDIRANQRLPLRLTPRNEELPYARDDAEAAPAPAPPRSPPFARLYADEGEGAVTPAEDRLLRAPVDKEADTCAFPVAKVLEEQTAVTEVAADCCRV